MAHYDGSSEHTMG